MLSLLHLVLFDSAIKQVSLWIKKKKNLHFIAHDRGLMKEWTNGTLYFTFYLFIYLFIFTICYFSFHSKITTCNYTILKCLILKSNLGLQLIDRAEYHAIYITVTLYKKKNMHEYTFIHIHCCSHTNVSGAVHAKYTFLIPHGIYCKILHAYLILRMF